MHQKQQNSFLLNWNWVFFFSGTSEIFFSAVTFLLFFVSGVAPDELTGYLVAGIKFNHVVLPKDFRPTCPLLVISARCLQAGSVNRIGLSASTEIEQNILVSCYTIGLETKRFWPGLFLLQLNCGPQTNSPLQDSVWHIRNHLCSNLWKQLKSAKIVVFLNSNKSTNIEGEFHLCCVQ